MKKIIILFISIALYAFDLTSEKLFLLTEQISGKKLECLGYGYFSDLEKYKEKLLDIFNDKDLYKKPIKDYDKYYEYFRYWGYQSIGNKRLFDKFNKESQKFCKKFKTHFKKNSGTFYEKSCEYFVQRLGMRAFGSITKFIKFDGIYSEFLELNSKDSIAFLNEINPNYYELDFLLKLALLDKKDLSVIDFLVKNGANIDYGYESALFYSLDYYEALKYLLNEGANVNYKNSFGKTPIFYAIENNDLETVKLLISYGANVNQKLIDNEEQIKLNLPYYISICEYTHPSKTLFIYAIAYHNLEILKLLINSGADYKKTDNLGLNALDYAIMYNNKDTIEFLKELGLEESDR